MASSEIAFDQIVFSGGGTRCFWQAGFIDFLRKEVGLKPERICGVSGGALTACGFVLNKGTEVLDIMCDEFSKLDRNVNLHDLTDGGTAPTPHQRTYRRVVERSLPDEDQVRIAKCDISVQILIGRPPDGDWPTISGTLVEAAYVADTKLRSSPHLHWAQALGMTGELVNAISAAKDGTLVDLVSTAATIPPVFEPPIWDGRPAIDAGMVDQAPMPEPDEGRSLIVLTKQFRNLPEVKGRVYVQPPHEVPADKIDFTDPDKLRRTWTMGENDARKFLKDRKED